ncbi:hypothetical protein C8R45DRAFT_1042946 [Mycena sanguinolenta]|nr:hypothetical protein C8R45DRAFT_1042946 [Mycena sanguinolenta]
MPKFTTSEDHHLTDFIVAQDPTGTRRSTKELYKLLGPKASAEFSWSRHRSRPSWMNRYRNNAHVFENYIRISNGQGVARREKMGRRLPTAPPVIKTVGFTRLSTPATCFNIAHVRTPTSPPVASLTTLDSESPATVSSRLAITGDSPNKILALASLKAHLLKEKANEASRSLQFPYRGALAQPSSSSPSKNSCHTTAAKPYERLASPLQEFESASKAGSQAKLHRKLPGLTRRTKVFSVDRVWEVYAVAGTIDRTKEQLDGKGVEPTETRFGSPSGGHRSQAGAR